MGYMLPVFVPHNFQPRRPCSQISDDEGAWTADTLRIGIIPENRLLNQPLLPSRLFFVSFGHRDSVYASGFAPAWLHAMSSLCLQRWVHLRNFCSRVFGLRSSSAPIPCQVQARR